MDQAPEPIVVAVHRFVGQALGQVHVVVSELQAYPQHAVMQLKNDGG
jgi:hypothetical protein